MKNDLRFAFRMLATHRWFSAAVIVTLALGIGINTTVFTLVNAVLFKPVPVPGGERLVTVAFQNLKKENSRTNLSLPDFREFKAGNRSFEGLEALTTAQAIIAEQALPPDRYRMARVTSGMFSMLHQPPVLGRGFTAESDRPGAPTTVLIGYRVWQNRYGGAPDIVGRAIRLNGQPATIIGVMPDGFRFPQNEDVWTPLVPNDELEKRSSHWLQVMGMRQPGVSIAAANADLNIIAQNLAKEYPDTNRDLGAMVRTFHDTFNGGEIKMVFLTMLGAVGFVLLIACANVANMMLSRAVGRSRELAVRVSVGATRGQIVRQLLVESILLSVLGGLLGLGLSLFGIHAFDVATQDVGKPYWIQFTMDYVVFAYFAAISVLSGIAFGLVPALRASRVDLNSMLKDGTPSGGSARGGKLTASLVVLQFALTVVLLAAAGMMVRSFFAAQSVNSFIAVDRYFTGKIQLPSGKEDRYAEPLARRQFSEKMLAQIATLPGVTHAASGSNMPGDGAGTRDIEIEGRPLDNPEQRPKAMTVVQTPDYLPAIGLPILAGRGFNEIDGDPGHEAAVVTREFAAKYWPGENVVGKRFRFIQNKKPGEWMTVIGACADITQDMRAKETPPPLCYIPYRQQPGDWIELLIHTSTDPNLLASPVRAVVQKLDPELVVFEARSLGAMLEHQRWFIVVFGSLFAVFAACGLLIASVGIYAVVAQSTSRRTREIGIRMALGSSAGGILRLVLSRGLRQLAIGLAIGLVGAMGATRVLKSGGFLMQVSPNDPLVFAVITLLLVAIGVLACLIPAMKAARIEPTRALRTE